MGERICVVDGCNKPPRPKTRYCSMHRERYRKYRSFDLPKRAPIEERFWAKVAIGAADDCWEWQGVRNANNYGVSRDRLGHDVPARHAHRVSFYFTHGYYPPVVRHTCDNPPCCNPAHLLPGTQADNAADKVRRGRSTRGGAVHFAFLTETDVREIRASSASGIRGVDLAERFGVTPHTIYEIVRRRSWRHVY